MVNIRKKITVFSIITVFIALMIFSTDIQNVTAGETLSVQIQASQTTIPIYTKVQLSANASGSLGGYLYRWYANDSAISDNFTSATCTFNVTQIGTYRIGCLVADASGVAGSTSAPEIYLTVTPKPMAQGQGPSASPETSSGNQELTTITAAVVAIAVVGAATVIIIKRRKPKQSNNP